MYGLANVNYELSGSINYGTTFEDEISGGIHYYVMADYGLSIMLYGSASVHYIPHGMISSSESMQDSLSGSLEYTVTSSYSISYPDSWTVHFKDYNGTTLKTVTNVAYEGYAAPPNTNQQEQVIHLLVGTVVLIKLVTQNETITATYGANKYMLYLNENGGSAVSDKIVTYDSAIGTISTPSNSPHRLVGWFDTSATEGGNEYTSSTVYKIAGNSTIWARWTYTLTFNANGGTVSPTSREHEHDEVVGTLPTPTRTNTHLLNGNITVRHLQRQNECQQATSRLTLYGHLMQRLAG